MKFALENNGDLREEIGWDEMVKTVAGIRDSLPAEQQQNVGDDGEKLRGAGSDRDSGAGLSFAAADQRNQLGVAPRISGDAAFDSDRAGTVAQGGGAACITSCRLAGHNGNSFGVKNEESEDHPDIFVCGPPRLPWPEFWKEYQGFG